MIYDFLHGVYRLTEVHAALCVAGVVMGVTCHQLWGSGFFGAENCTGVRVMQRVSFLALSLSMVWSLSYAHVHQWQPWPSYVLTLIAVDLYLFSVLLAAFMREGATSHG